jgi:hypothetical protein
MKTDDNHTFKFCIFFFLRISSHQYGDASAKHLGYTGKMLAQSGSAVMKIMHRPTTGHDIIQLLVYNFCCSHQTT